MTLTFANNFENSHLKFSSQYFLLKLFNSIKNIPTLWEVFLTRNIRSNSEKKAGKNLMKDKSYSPC